MRKRNWMLLPLVIVCVACAATADDPAPPDDEPATPGITRVEPGTNLDEIKSDGFELGEVTIEGDTLKISVSYAGGAADHDFTLYWNGIVARSYPGQTTFVLKHDANSDTAEAWLTQTLTFDLSTIIKPMIITVRTDHGDSARVQYGER